MLNTLLFVLAFGSDPAQMDRLDLLVSGLAAEAPWLEPAEVSEHVEAALGAELDSFPAELMLAIAWRESKFDPSAGPACGVMQVIRKYISPHDCRATRTSAAAGYEAGARIYAGWVEQCRGDRKRRVSVLRCALNGYAEGTKASRRGWGIKGCGRARCDRSRGPLGRARRIAAGGPAQPERRPDA